MATKRSFSELDAPSEQSGWSQKEAFAKRQKKANHNPKEGTINWAKRRARTIERRFQKDKEKIPANVQNDLERELAALQSRIAESSEKKQRSTMIGKYHMVRFFERKKALRLEKQLKRRLEKATDTEEVSVIRADLHIAEVDKMYTLYYPFLERYISLYPVADISKKKEETAEEKSAAALQLRAERPPMWKTVERAMESGQRALEKLRDRKNGGENQPTPAPAQQRSQRGGEPTPKAGSKQRHHKQGSALAGHNGADDTKDRSDKYAKTDNREGHKAATQAQEPDSDDEADDGGFFEED